MHLLIIAFLVLMWGVSPLIYKQFLVNVDYKTIMVLVGLVNFIGAITLFLLNSDTILSDFSKMPGKIIILFCLMALVTYFIAHTLYLYVLKDNAAYAVTSILSAAPLITLLASVLIFKQKVHLIGIVGVVLTSLGVAAIVQNGTTPK